MYQQEGPEIRIVQHGSHRTFWELSEEKRDFGRRQRWETAWKSIRRRKRE